MGSDCCNRIDQWQAYKFEKKLATADRELAMAADIGYNAIRIIIEFEVWDRQHDGFIDRLERYIATAYKHGLSSMIVLSNDCAVAKSVYKPAEFGEQKVEWGYHGGRKNSPHVSSTEERYSVLDDPANLPRYKEMIRELISIYAHDERVIVWNLMNEPGNYGRGEKSLPQLKSFFEIARDIDPIQPLCADVWTGINEDGTAKTEIEQFAIDNSDIISYHCYSDYAKSVERIKGLKKTGRPLLNTEWLHRVNNNNVKEQFPLFYLERIGCFNWGFVAGKYQTYEPWETFWDILDEHPEFDITKWQHDLLRPSGRPYDPKEIELIKHFCKKADEDFERDHKK